MRCGSTLISEVCKDMCLITLWMIWLGDVALTCKGVEVRTSGSPCLWWCHQDLNVDSECMGEKNYILKARVFHSRSLKMTDSINSKWISENNTHIDNSQYEFVPIFIISENNLNFTKNKSKSYKMTVLSISQNILYRELYICSIRELKKNYSITLHKFILNWYKKSESTVLLHF